MKLSSKMSFTEHILDRSKSAKISIHGGWHEVLNDENISIQVKLELFKAAVRSIQLYACQIFGYEYEEEINKLQLFFIKFILRMPQFTPTYAIFLEPMKSHQVYML